VNYFSSWIILISFIHNILLFIYFPREKSKRPLSSHRTIIEPLPYIVRPQLSHTETIIYTVGPKLIPVATLIYMLLAKNINILDNFLAFINFQTLTHQTESLILLIVIPLLVSRRFKIPLLKIGPLLSHHPITHFQVNDLNKPRKCYEKQHTCYLVVTRCTWIMFLKTLRAQKTTAYLKFWVFFLKTSQYPDLKILTVFVWCWSVVFGF
jgi:hypothetical protein